MLRSLFGSALLVALVLAAAPSFAASSSLIDRLANSSGEMRAEVLQEVLHTAHHARADLDAAALVPVLLTIAQEDESAQIRVMAAQAIAQLGTRSDARQLRRLARRDASPWARRQMQLAAASVLNG